MAARSVAVWQKTTTNVGTHSALTPCSAELHFNLWRFPVEKVERNFLDIGISLNDWQDIESLHIFIPSGNAQITAKDLGPKFSDPNIAVGIFNDPLNVTSGSLANFCDISDENRQPYTRVYRFSQPLGGSNSEHGWTIRPDGVILEIKRRVIEALKVGSYTGKIYFRLRFELGGTSPLIKRRKPSDAFLQSGIEYTDFIDFRLNEARNIPNDVALDMISADCSPVLMNRIDYLLVVDIEADMIVGHENSNKSRILEKELWAPYLDNRVMPDDMIIYHWKKVQTPPNSGPRPEDFSNFVKLRMRKSSRKTICWCLFWIFVVSILANWASEGFTDQITWVNDTYASWFLEPPSVSPKDAPDPQKGSL